MIKCKFFVRRDHTFKPGSLYLLRGGGGGGGGSLHLLGASMSRTILNQINSQQKYRIRFISR